MHKQGLSEETVEPDFRLGISLQLIALAVHLLEDEDEQVQFIFALPASCQAFYMAARPNHATPIA